MVERYERRDDDEDDDREFEQRGPRRDLEPDDGLSTLIPYKNGKALAAYYCGVFGIIPVLGLILGPIALLLGILGLKVARNHPSAKGTGHAIAGIVLGTIASVGNYGCIAFLGVMALSARK